MLIINYRIFVGDWKEKEKNEEKRNEGKMFGKSIYYNRKLSNLPSSFDYILSLTFTCS